MQLIQLSPGAGRGSELICVVLEDTVLLATAALGDRPGLIGEVPAQSAKGPSDCLHQMAYRFVFGPKGRLSSHCKVQQQMETCTERVRSIRVNHGPL